VAAHLPVVMTDLPVSLLAVTAVVLATVAFRSWAWTDLAWCSLALGLALGAKHSAPVFAVFLAFAGVAVAAIPSSRQPSSSCTLRIFKVSLVMLGALFILWGLYFFHFHESRAQNEVFNRPLNDKIADVNSEAYRFTLTSLAAAHALPRAYIWGLADVVRAGLVGRAYSQLAFGRLFYNKVPRYFFPGVIAVKVPLGLSLLSILGVVLVLQGQTPPEWRKPTIILLAAALCFFVALSSGSTYAGIRHGLPLLVFWSIPGGFAVHLALSSRSKFLRGFVALALLAAIASAVPVMRPWEYYNETVGGAANAYRYFDDEGVDLSQRVKELAKYYHEVIQPTGEIPYVNCEWSLSERRKRGIDWVGHDPKRDEDRITSSIWSGTIITEAKLISRRLWWDAPELREATPVARFGNLMVFRGQFRLPELEAAHFYYRARHELFSDHPDLTSAETLLRQSGALDPNAFFVNIELGNVCLRLGFREDALHAYSAALQHAPSDPDMRHSIQQQIQRVSVENLDQIPALRDPGIE
jgi:hypothetical protein